MGGGRELSTYGQCNRIAELSASAPLSECCKGKGERERCGEIERGGPRGDLVRLICAHQNLSFLLSTSALASQHFSHFDAPPGLTVCVPNLLTGIKRNREEKCQKGRLMNKQQNQL